MRNKCEASVYYVMPSDYRYTRLMIHQGTHQHAVQRGCSRGAIHTVKALVKEVVSTMETVGPRKIQMEIIKKIAFGCAIRSHTGNGENISQLELSQLLQEMYPLVETER